MRISEIFYSIQGEGLRAGLPCIFVRLSGCNEKCVYCDTTYADEYTEMTIDEVQNKIIKIASQTGCELVEFTGGEPLLQQNELVKLLYQLPPFMEYIIETNGSYDIKYIKNYMDTIIMDIKCPSSGMQDKNLLSNIPLLRQQDELKFVVGTKKDLDYVMNILSKHETLAHILISPIWDDELTLQEIAEFVLKFPRVRMQIQMHKIIWKPDARGV